MSQINRLGNLRPRLQGLIQRKTAALMNRRPIRLSGDRPIISFTFDDFPRSALFTGGETLRRYGVLGTYYVSLGLAGTVAPTGQLFEPRDLEHLLSEGHELGCHTFSHCHSWDTTTQDFERSVLQNRQRLSELVPGAAFKTFSYPISPPRPATKAKIGTYFAGCRGGGQIISQESADLNYLAAYFLEKSRDRLDDVRGIIDWNKEACGWLILATHDVSPTPTPYGCVPEFFEKVVQYSVDSGARILTVAAAVEELVGKKQ